MKMSPTGGTTSGDTFPVVRRDLAMLEER